ncbi:restriction methylase [Xenorhabdus mauleonii]|uniref:Restriction methylase n=1 Tax=Xenorhabdus mauleonii TaxID=351675 RepID=A0A1I3V6W0_9GAMM|nr:class I SAM-dependent methyltransferase [Xenorhabdus mauleonii]PHM37650.1 restriction methylase [Xenorhabdus mauleonii]SFJ90892.1 protein of unknown function [Xenorhabdus mauleonii]
MSEITINQNAEIFDAQFFAPTSSDFIDSIIGEYRLLRENIEKISNSLSSHEASVHHFLRGNGYDKGVYDVSKVFARDGAIASLNATFWQKALDLTDVYEYMPNDRRSKWSESIREMKTPEFEEETVRFTMNDLLNSRKQFFSERVDGIFRALSGEHVTNRPEGFGKRMILSHIFDGWGHLNYDRKGYIHDLRHIIAKFMGLEEPKGHLTERALHTARARHGEWQIIDGGTLRIRAYLKGTVHLEVHPEMAWRLNSILAFLHPMAIPPEFRQKPKRKLKEFTMIDTPLDYRVRNTLNKMKAERYRAYRNYNGEVIEPLTTNPFNLTIYLDDRAMLEQVDKVLQSIGGVLFKPKRNDRVMAHIWEFDYDPEVVIGEIISSGCLPEKKSHQYYPTPSELAEIAIHTAEIDVFHRCLEPSAGQGGLAKFMPKERTTCIELSDLHCKILETKGFTALQSDFLKYAESTTDKFDRIVMNPPFSEGRAKAHLEAALELLSDSGILVAILPTGMKNKSFQNGFSYEWSDVYSNMFVDASIDVVILKVQKE